MKPRARFARLALRPAAAVALLIALGAPGASFGYVRYEAMEGARFAWPNTCVFITAYPGDFTEMPAEEVENAIRASAAAWSTGNNPCTYLSLMVEFSAAAPPRARPRDRRNVVIFRTEDWCALDDNGECDPIDPNYPPEALALTTVSAVTTTGEIRDVDIEVNDLWHDWADLVAHPELASGNTHDLENALTHEFGHLIGLDHTCFPPGAMPPIPLDHQGMEIPLCGDTAPDAVRETTMYNSAPPGEVGKRTLAPDDQLALCEIYPASQDPGRCVPPSDGDDGGCGCASASGGASPGGGGPLVGLALAVVLGGVLLVCRRKAT